jgi:hypothetical protein
MDQIVRRIVTGHDAQGRSVFVEDSSTVMAGALHEVWMTPAVPASYGGAPRLGPLPVGLEPPQGGTLIRFVRLPPTAGLSREELDRRTAQMFADIHASHARVDTSRHPAMHKTHSVDYGIVLSGEVTLMLDVGERKLKPFDVAIQRGTNHGWVNAGPEPCLIAFILIDGKE